MINGNYIHRRYVMKRILIVLAAVSLMACGDVPESRYFGSSGGVRESTDSGSSGKVTESTDSGSSYKGFKVTFDFDDGTIYNLAAPSITFEHVKDGQYTVNNPANPVNPGDLPGFNIPNPTKLDYTFVGWAKDGLEDPLLKLSGGTGIPSYNSVGNINGATFPGLGDTITLYEELKFSPEDTHQKIKAIWGPGKYKLIYRVMGTEHERMTGTKAEIRSYLMDLDHGNTPENSGIPCIESVAFPKFTEAEVAKIFTRLPSNPSVFGNAVSKGSQVFYIEQAD
jgi:hypothetical protein